MKDLIKSLTLEEKAKLVTGYSNMESFPINKKGIRALKMSDGPNGVRKTDESADNLSGISQSLPTTCFPSGSVLASTFNEELIYEVGEAIGKECNLYDVNLLLGPSLNIKRNPLCGRNFEYYSEDPYLTSRIGVNFVKGVRSRKVGCAIKHFALNNNEKYRFTGNSICDLRTMHEIYFPSFKAIVQEANPLGIMSSYNKINGINASENSYLLNDLLREKWGFDGLSVTDWGGIVSRDLGLKAGTDLEMPGQNEYNPNLIVNKIKSGELDEKYLDKAVNNLLNVIKRTELVSNKVDKSILELNYEVALKAGIEGTVLLKNSGMLPLNKGKKYLFIGELFSNDRYQGSGSALINPYKLTKIINVLNKKGISYEYSRGYGLLDTDLDSKLLEEALNAAKNYEEIIVAIGQSDLIESEGFDRETTKLPQNQLVLLEKLTKLNKKITLCIFNGSSINLDGYENKVDSIIYYGLLGEAIGDVFFNTIYGISNPSGRLNETWLNSYSDYLFKEEFNSCRDSYYKENIFVGYRYYDTFNIDTLYPFGYGLSYSSFEYSDFKIKRVDNDLINISLKITNTSNLYKGKDVIEIYVSKPNSSLLRAKKELKAFKKVELEPNESKEVIINLKSEDLKVFDITKEDFVLENGEYKIYISKNVKESLYEDVVSLKGEKINTTIPKALSEKYQDKDLIKTITNEEYLSFVKENNKYFKELQYDDFKKATLETPLFLLKGVVGKIFVKAVVGVGEKQYKKGLKNKDPIIREREMKAGNFVAKMMPYNSLRSLAFSSGGSLKIELAKGILEMNNGHILKGLKLLLNKDKNKKDKEGNN